jgi:asparagine synthase (glutamine-hydrolysing)
MSDGINFPQFMGYWGYGNCQELTGLLNQVINGISESGLMHPKSETGFLRQYLFTKPTIFRRNPVSLRKSYEYQKMNTNYVGRVDKYPIFKIWSILAHEELEFSRGLSISAAGVSGCRDAWVNFPDHRLILGRESFGRIPLYWCKLGEVIWFASRLQLLLKVIDQPEINIAALYGYSCFSYVPTPLTPVDSIQVIPAGTELMWRWDDHLQIISPPESLRIQEWQEATTQVTDTQDAIAQLQLLLKNAIQSQIHDLKDEPVGVFLSGGLDSSIVAALLVEAGVKVRAYSLDFGGVGISEFAYAEQVAEFLNIPLIKVLATPKQIKNALIPTIKALDLPFGDGVTVPLYLLNQAASQETQVIFNGEGGDQLFAGWTNKPAIAASIYGENDFTRNYLHTFHRLWGYEAQVFQPHIYNQIQQLHPEDWLQSALDPTLCQGFLHRLRRGSLMLKGAQNIHPRATNLGFAHGLRVRSPFCDLDLARWTFQVGGELFLQGSCEKYILKRAVENLLPPEIIWRKKRGMGVPLTSWCVNSFWYQIGDWLNPGILHAGEHFHPQIAAQIVSGELGANIQERRIGEILWLLMMWELWKIHVLGVKPGKKSANHPFWIPRSLWQNYRQFKNF